MVNIHHATALAPYINDPLLSADTLAAYTESAHGLGLKVKVYNTVRELTAHSPEVLPLLQLGGEIFPDGAQTGGAGAGHIWLQEHAPAGYVSAWYAPNVDDIAVVTAGESRWQNAYIHGLDQLLRRTGLDGVYLDDIAYDRHTMKRVRKVLARHCAQPEVDIHSANQFNAKDGLASSANLYLELLPYTDRLWLGEYFDYDAASAAYWLVEVSGIPFGLMGEMLEGGGNPWRGMVFAMTGRAPRVDNRPLWDFWANHRLAEADMVGWWAANAPVRTSHPEVLATSWLTPAGLVVALASWAGTEVDVQLEFSPGYAQLASAERDAPPIHDFQAGRRYAPKEHITVRPQRGLLLVIGTSA
ncbi:glycoside hydrolase domain-containing protein [Pseudarthrobacter sp. P1]|uniref:glycoside hydrolase domain-containing protein n=1 Tax=Pseudarthrobacter sp. P1 TaxID=3418418 RepID=UPI003CE6AFDC